MFVVKCYMKPILIALLAAASTLMGAETNSIGNSAAPLNVTAGQEFTIRLDSNRTTGYRWQLAKPLEDSSVKLVGNEYQAPNAPRRPGAGGVEVWAFKALAPGKTEIAMKYVRPWETNAPPARTTNIVVVITAREPK